MKRSLLPSKIIPGQITAIIDTREQYPLDLSPLQTKVGTLTTGDYSVVGMEHLIAVERKSLDDLLGCIGRERERFERELQRLAAYPYRMVVVESGRLALDRGEWRSQITPEQVINSILSWQSRYCITFWMAYTHEIAGRDVAKFLYHTVRDRYYENRPVLNAVLEADASGATGE